MNKYLRSREFPYDTYDGMGKSDFTIFKEKYTNNIISVTSSTFYTEQSLLKINDFINKIKNNKKDYVVSFLHIDFEDEGDLHSNVLIYNRKINTIIHYEPQGTIRKTLKNALIKYFIGSDIKLDFDYSIVFDFQTIQKNMMSYEKYDGFCGVWSMAFIEMYIYDDIYYKYMKIIKEVGHHNFIVEYWNNFKLQKHYDLRTRVTKSLPIYSIDYSK